MEQGIGLETEYESSPAVFTASDGSTWPVTNSDGSGSGLLPLGEAMVRSVNGVYARLGLQLGAEEVRSQARVMGVRSKLPPHPSIALGAGEVSVVDMAAAYATLANGGTAVEPTTLEKVTLSNGQVMKPEQEIFQSAVSPGNAYLLTKVLEQVITRGTGTQAQIGRPAAGKTGTTDDYADAWFVGYTPSLVTAVWVGYPEGRISMSSVHGIRVYGGTLPALIWRNFMQAALATTPIERFRLPTSELETVLINPATGLLAASWCEGEPRKMLRQLIPTEYCPVPPPEPSPVVTPSPSPSGKKPSPSPSTSPKDDKGDDGEPSPSPDASPSPKGSPKGDEKD
jgi:penicillin-binding protein 1A